MEWEAVEYLKVSRWDQKSQITTVEYILPVLEIQDCGLDVIFSYPLKLQESF